MQAKSQADAISARYAQQVAGKSVKDTADLMAEASRQISQIYQEAEQACQSQASTCRQECSDEDGASLASACDQEIGKYTQQVGSGRRDDNNANQDANYSSDRAKSGAGSTAAGRNSNSPYVASSPSALNPTSERRSGPGVNPYDAVSGGDSSSINSVFGANPNGVDAGSANNVDGASEQALGASRQCAGSDLTCLRQQVTQFCSDGKSNGDCPSCVGAAGLEKLNAGQMKAACSSSCLRDPVYGEKLITQCQFAARKEAEAPSVSGGHFSGGSLVAAATQLLTFGSRPSQGGSAGAAINALTGANAKLQSSVEPKVGRLGPGASTTEGGAERRSASGEADVTFQKLRQRSPAGSPATVVGTGVGSVAEIGALQGPTIFVVNTRVLVEKCRQWKLKSCTDNSRVATSNP